MHGYSQVFDWGVNLCDSSNYMELATIVEVDSFGNSYVVVSFTQSTDADPGVAFVEVFSQGHRDFLISKFAEDGSFLWSIAIGGAGEDHVRDMAIDPNGNIYLCGSFEGVVDFDPGIGVYNLTCPNTNEDGFVIKLDGSGTLMWAYNLNDSDYSFAKSIGIDSNGHITVGGDFRSVVDFDFGSGNFQVTTEGGFDIYLLQMDEFGNFLWVRTFGNSESNSMRKLAVDYHSGNCYMGSPYYPIDFDPGFNEHYLVDDGFLEMVVTKLDGQGNFLWARGLKAGAMSSVNFMEMGVTLNDEVYVCGDAHGTVGFDLELPDYYITANGGCDALIFKLDPTGQLNWIHSFGGSACDRAWGLAIDEFGGVYLTGAFLDTIDFDPSDAVYEVAPNGVGDVFISKFNAVGEFGWAYSLGSMAFEEGGDITIDKSNSIYACGYCSDNEYVGIFDPVDIDPTETTFNIYNPNGGPYLIKLTQSDLGFVTNLQDVIFSLYPNPAQTYFEINCEYQLAELALLNISGDIVFYGQVTYGVNTISLDGVSAGFYLVSLRTQDKTDYYKLIVKNNQ